MRAVSRSLWALVAFAALAAPAGAAAPGAEHPWPERIAAAERFADGRTGRVSFAVVDERGGLRGEHVDRIHNSASVVKVMFMVALLREPEVRDGALGSGLRRLIGPMIKRSDNQAATAVYRRVGEPALYELARDAGMDSFTTQPTWGLSTITAREQARFMYRLEEFVPRRHRRYAMHLLGRIVRSQRWGIPPAAPNGWKLHFKGGWSGRPSWRVNQVMLLRKPPRRLALAILTREQPSKGYGERSIEGVARRLLRGYE
jgi:beta-lactamase class A